MIHFGTGGWRAVIGDEFTRANVQLVAAALARLAKENGQAQKAVAIGYDRRFLSRQAAQWAAEVLAAQGIQTQIIHREAPTPLVMFAVKHDGLAYGMAVTASHNPAEYNGIKIFMQGGRDADEALTGRLEAYIAEIAPGSVPVLPLEQGLARGAITYIDPMNLYIDRILHSIDTGAIRERGLHIALDPMYGVSQTALQTILLTARCHVEVIHERRDPLFGGRLPAPNTKTLVGLVNFVREHHCDIGIATDGDADRLGVVDDQAHFLHPNEILCLLYYYLLQYKGWHGPAVRNFATTHLLDKIAKVYGETCYEVPVGFKHISAKMRETGALIGGESSGGLTVRGHIEGKDGIYAASLLAEMIAVTGRPLSALYREITGKFGDCAMEERSYRFPPQKKAGIYRLLIEEKRLPAFAFDVDRVSYADGCKVYFCNGGWIIARFSGTEPLLRIFCEMENPADAAATADCFADFLGLRELA